MAGLAALCGRMASLLRQQSRRDSLTGLLDRRGLHHAAERCGPVGPGDRIPWSVAGDRLSCDLADPWRTELRCGDVLARTGGDEFVLLLPGDEVAAGATVERLRERTPRPVGVSAGITPRAARSDLERSLRRADALLHDSGRAGRGRTHRAGTPTVSA